MPSTPGPAHNRNSTTYSIFNFADYGVNQDLVVRALTGGYADKPYPFSGLKKKGMVATVRFGRGLQHDDAKRWSQRTIYYLP